MGTFNIRVELGDTGLNAADALDSIRDALRPLINILEREDDPSAIPDQGEIYDPDGNFIGTWWKQ